MKKEVERVVDAVLLFKTKHAHASSVKAYYDNEASLYLSDHSRYSSKRIHT